ncbi:G-protein alpha subunit-domain-containing protein [Paraphoma chrysanthemicola]|uniref:G-protein alpha subunit-domain-containing protein n=1 Tax=Paraphoma chrysanthemicola TaxID=798071 RepID=A0A8K0W2A8_9PLEO|nr:G-protein alpha subunit-domain-containing protein [Paraphoma chrysanthemicola]
MADSQPNEKAVYALIAAVASNMNRLRQGIDGLRQIHNRWKGNDGISINLIAQLTALKSNLGSMHDWLNHALSDMHPQLLSDLDVLMSSCSLLVRHLDALVRRLHQRDHDSIDCATRLKYAVGGRSMERLRKVAQLQNESVTLLLAACKCHASAQRKILLHKSRQIRREDANSLKVLTRSSRVDGSCMGALTQASAMIQWFRYVFYIKLLRNQAEHVPTEEDYDLEAAAIRSDAIDRALQDDATTLRRETKLVMMGNVNSGKELVMHQMKVLYADGYYPLQDRKPYRYAVRSTVRLLIHSIIDLLKDTGISLPSELNQEFAILLHEVETVDMQFISKDAAQAVERIWTCPEFATLFIKNFEIDFPQYASYFAQEVQRMASPDYIPTEADIIRLNQSIGGISELRFHWDELEVHLFNINNGYIPGSEKFADSSIILLLNNFTRFREKLPHSPLETFFADYVPSDIDPETSARQYILRRFKDVNRNRLSIYSFWVDLDLSDNAHLYAALKKTLQHIQQRRAREEVWNASSTSMGSGSRSGTGLASRLLASRSGTSLRKRAGTDASRVLSPVQSH